MEQNKSNLHVGEIIRITNSYTIIVNAGGNSLSVGDRVQIYVPGEPLYDLDGKFIANYEHIKDELEVIQVEPSYSVCKKKKVTERKVTFPVAPLLEHTFYDREPLRVKQEDIQRMPDYDNTVHVGDFVKKIY